MDVEIREYTKNDLASLIHLSSDQWAPTIESLQETVLPNYDGKNIKILLASSGEEIIGFIYGYISPDKALFPEYLYVKPEYRGKKIGLKLLDELEKQSGCLSSMIFYNSSLHNYYKARGYETADNLEAAVKDLREVRNRRIIEDTVSRIKEYLEKEKTDGTNN